MKNKCKIEYPNLPSAAHPVPHSIEIPPPVFIQLSFLEHLDHDELSDSNDADFEIEDDSYNKRFYYELNGLAQDLRLSKKTSELLANFPENLGEVSDEQGEWFNQIWRS